jgi:hypothetical protein
MATPFDRKDSLRNKWAAVHAHKAIIDTWNKQIKVHNSKRADLVDLPEDSIGAVELTPLPEVAIPKELPSPPALWQNMTAPEKGVAGADDPPETLKVCIVGAGPAGLFTGLILDYIKSKIPDFNVTYQILEAADAGPYPSPVSPIQRGGRLFSYSWETEDTKTPRLYYDVGAMRFPENPVMKRYA